MLKLNIKPNKMFNDANMSIFKKNFNKLNPTLVTVQQNGAQIW